MVLVVTQRGDLTADWLIREFEERGAPFVRFNTEDYPTAVGLSWQPHGASLRIRDETYPLSDFTAVWYRRPVVPRVSADLSPEAARWAVREAWEALQGVWRTLDTVWVNRPDANRAAESKPEQLRTAAALGFEVPETLVTNEPDKLRAFLATHPAAICKPLGEGQVPVDDGDEAHLFFTTGTSATEVPVEKLGPEPYLFQNRIAKDYDVRVTVIGEDVFAARIESQGRVETQIDWRRGDPGHLAHEVETLPAEVTDRCVALCRHYDLRFGAVDLARRPDGGYTFFELNPNGQWAWIEQRTGLPLRARLADLLLAPVRL